MPTTTVHPLRAGEGRVDISFDGDMDFEALAEAVKAQYLQNEPLSSSEVLWPVREVVIHGGDEHEWETKRVRPFLEVMKQLRSVTRLEFHHFMPEGDTADENGWLLPLELPHLLVASRFYQLEYLEFASVTSCDDGRNLKNFCTTLVNMQSLRRLKITGTFAIGTPSGGFHRLDCLVSAISKIPMLQELDIQTQWWEGAGKSTWFVSPDDEALKVLCSNPTVQKLTVGDFHPNSDALKPVTDLVTVAAASDTSCPTTNTTTRLRQLHLNFASSLSAESEPSILGLITALENNQTLKYLQLDYYGKIPQLGGRSCWLGRMIRAVENALVSLLQSNFTLEHVGIFCTEQNDNSEDEDEEEEEDEEEYEVAENILSLEGCKRAEIELYLRLNKEGRKELMKTTHSAQIMSREQWITEFADKLSYDLDGLFYYLKNNPWLCQREEEEAAPLPLPRGEIRMPEYLLVPPATQSDAQKENLKLKWKLLTMAQQHEDEVEVMRREIAALKNQLEEN